MKKYLFIQRKEDLQQIINLNNNLENINQEELVNKFNREVKIGFTGVHQQALLVLALNQEFIKRYNEAPVTVENNVVLRFKGTIKTIEKKIIIYETN